MKNAQYLKTIIILIATFISYQLLFMNFKFIKVSLDKITQQGLISYILSYLIVGIPIFLGTYLITKKLNILKSLGIQSDIIKPFGLGFIFTLPMFIGGFFCFDFNTNIDFQTLIASTLIAGLMEELYYRGFLFGILYKKTNFGFITSILIGAIIFASGHLYQSQDIIELIGIFSITFFGAIFFAWLFIEWKFNLWIPIFTHTLMNLAWHVFQIDNSALGDITTNIFRGFTICTAILFTIVYKRKNNIQLEITKNKLFFK